MPFSLRSLTLILAALASGCFGSGSVTRVTSDYAAMVKTVGVVSLLSPNVNISYLSTSAAESALSSATIKGWDPDRLVRSALIPRFQRKGYTVRELARNEALEKARASDWRAPMADRSVAEAVYALAESSGLDIVVVVQANVGPDFVTDTNQKVRGYGIQKAFDTEAFVYATIFVETFDIKRRSSVGRANGELFEPAQANLWDAAFEKKNPETAVQTARAATLTEQLERLVTTAIGIATQESGL